MIENIEDISAAVTRLVEPLPEIELCIMYGSAVTGNLRDHSDIDIAVGSERNLSSAVCLELSTKLTLEFDREVSVIDLKKMDGIILQEVLVKGILIKSSNSTYHARCMVRMWEFVEDLLPYQISGIGNKLNGYLHE